MTAKPIPRLGRWLLVSVAPDQAAAYTIVGIHDDYVLASHRREETVRFSRDNMLPSAWGDGVWNYQGGLPWQ